MPVANAGNSLTINELQTVTLDASLSSDPDNDIASNNMFARACFYGLGIFLLIGGIKKNYH
jgi:hypothetical protein